MYITINSLSHQTTTYSYKNKLRITINSLSQQTTTYSYYPLQPIYRATVPHPGDLQRSTVIVIVPQFFTGLHVP